VTPQPRPGGARSSRAGPSGIHQFHRAEQRGHRGDEQRADDDRVEDDAVLTNLGARARVMPHRHRRED
jgi:hypothetical protein